MKIQIYCSTCNRMDEIEKEIENTSLQSISAFSIPIPGAKNGLTTYSLAHPDHTLIVDVDAEGNVRGERVIERIDSQLEKILAAISTKLLSIIENSDESFSFIVISESEMLKKILLGIFQQIVFNLPEEIKGLLSVSKDDNILDFNNLIIYVGKWKKKIYNLTHDNSAYIYHLTQSNFEDVEDNLITDFRMNIIDSYAVLFDGQFIQTVDGKDHIAKIMTTIPNVQFLDASNPINTAKAIHSIVDNFITENSITAN